MKIKDIWNKFLEFRKSPTCIICAIIGILDVISFLLLINSSQDTLNFIGRFYDLAFVRLLTMLSFAYISIMNTLYVYRIILALLLYILESITRVKFKSGFIDNKVYKIMWFFGATMFIIFCIVIPLL